MPRKPRAEYESGLYHVTARGNRREAIFVHDTDWRRYLALVGRVTIWNRWRCLTYCLMSNHVHLLIETRTPNLGFGMQRLQGTYAQSFNSHHDQVGHLFQGRYWATRIESDAQLWVTAAYIASNPVEAGLVRVAAAWPWSSHAAILDETGPPWLDRNRLLEYFADTGGDPLKRYADFTEAYANLKGLSL
ncbi:transposase [Solirubrobacter ginsenosidimutans]|uniref:Transposase n=1 Tax=Solirubrobacter ginsenosidimutans TaxID=490573 RepID=A0A9X3MXM0_9ACTN|nr:transposase [Solirubrobacter ginsenosidimutans]MDA0164599.1 transposase [Solirubrobacter ginsenosidimutans]